MRKENQHIINDRDAAENRYKARIDQLANENRQMQQKVDASKVYAEKANQWLTEYKVKIADEKAKYDNLKDLLVKAQLENKDA